MEDKENGIAIPDETIKAKIYMIRGKKVMFDEDLAELYGVETKRLNEQVKRNLSRFPDDFMFQLSKEEFINLKSQIATTSWGGRRTRPYAFTEHGVLMLSSVLNSERAIQANILIVRVFNRIRELLSTQKEILEKLEKIEKKDWEQDEKIMLIFDYLKQLEQSKQDEKDFKNRKKIGFKQSKE